MQGRVEASRRDVVVVRRAAIVDRGEGNEGPLTMLPDILSPLTIDAIRKNVVIVLVVDGGEENEEDKEEDEDGE